jgi:hypothetical protein
VVARVKVIEQTDASLPFGETYGSYASSLMVERNSPVGDVLMCFASRTAFSILSAPLLESANLRKNPTRLIRSLADAESSRRVKIMV